VDMERFGVNSTVGLFGFFDPAFTWLKLQRDDEDFGQTLGYYGMGSGFPIVLPFFGPSNLRDLTGNLVDSNLDPIYYVSYRRYNLLQNNVQALGAVTFKNLNSGSLHEREYQNLRKDAIDLYPFLQNAYEQHRKMLIKE
jgi:phospholipid-binding lipoprotein MlaA